MLLRRYQPKTRFARLPNGFHAAKAYQLNGFSVPIAISVLGEQLGFRFHIGDVWFPVTERALELNAFKPILEWLVECLLPGNVEVRICFAPLRVVFNGDVFGVSEESCGIE